MKKATIHPALIAPLHSCHPEGFTVLEFRDAYLTLNKDNPRNKIDARRFVYSHILQLVKRGLLEKHQPSSQSKPVYQITEKGTRALRDKGNLDTPSTNLDHQERVRRNLHEKLHHYKREMLSSIGETEEYDAICKELPHMKIHVQGLYDQARDRCTKTLGRVKALEAIIAQHQTSIPS